MVENAKLGLFKEIQDTWPSVLLLTVCNSIEKTRGKHIDLQHKTVDAQ